MNDWYEVNLKFNILMNGEDYSLNPDRMVGCEIELLDGRKYIIGNINTMGGVCNDCMDFYSETIVKRYRRLI